MSRMIIERLRRKVLALVTRARMSDATTYPDAVFFGPMVSILDENSGSDGDIFPAMFREAGLGPLIGKRSWGGVVGITNRGTLIDGGVVNVPEFGFAIRMASGSSKGTAWIRTSKSTTIRCRCWRERSATGTRDCRNDGEAEKQRSSFRPNQRHREDDQRRYDVTRAAVMF